MIFIKEILKRVYLLLSFMSSLVLAVSTGNVYAEQILTLSIQGQAQPYITSPSAQHLGVAPVTGDFAREISNADLHLGASHSNVILTSPEAGTYAVILHGTYDETLLITVQYRDTVLGTNVELSPNALFHGDSIQFDITLNPNDVNPLTIQPPLAEPGNVSVKNNAGLARLIWDASTDTNVTGYKVYGRMVQSAFFSEVGDVTTNTFDTTHPIKTDDTVDEWKYIVVSRSDDGKESFYSSVLSNELLIAAFYDADVRSGYPPLTVNFSDDSIGDPTSWSWDFDGDGVVDSTEQNPSFTYEQPGAYSVKLTVSGPIGTDEVVQSGYIRVLVDSDNDGIDDSVDNCSQVANPNQRDTDDDGFGNYCDGDLNNDDIVNGLDLGAFRQKYFSTDQNADFNGDGIVNGLDLGLFRQMYFKAPGPGAIGP